MVTTSLAPPVGRRLFNTDGSQVRDTSRDYFSYDHAQDYEREHDGRQEHDLRAGLAPGHQPGFPRQLSEDVRVT